MMESVNILPSIEVRWFFDQPVASLVSWFNAVAPEAEKEQPRSDDYLRFADANFVGVKLREYKDKKQLNLEFKLKDKDYGQFDFGNQVVGNMESWRKWSTAINFSAADYKNMITGEGGAWNTVNKLRTLAKFKFNNDTITAIKTSEKADMGCNVEFTELIPKYNTVSSGAVLYTFALEAFSSDSTIELMPILKQVMTYLISEAPPPALLSIENSYSYPQWLNKITY